MLVAEPCIVKSCSGMTISYRTVCPCILDGLAGPTCEERAAVFCINQCSGHGECHRGWCKCHEGYHGTDCAHMREGAVQSPGWLSRSA